MPPQEMLIDGVSVRAKGTGGGIAIARSRLLAVLLDEAVRAGVEVDFGAERNLGDVRDADLVIAADGAGSRTRAELAGHVGGHVVPGRGVFMWLGCATRLRSNLFVPVRTEHGLFTIHGYPYAEELSTLGVEADARTWRRAGMDTATERTPLTESDAFSLDYLQKAFADALGGAGLLGNRSRWMHFRTVSLPRWHHENVVLIGDAAHTAHYSVGSGTKMALEDAIVLADSLTTGEEPALAGALRRYEEIRRPRVEALQDAAVRSQRWWDSIGHRLDLSAPQLMLAYLSRGGVVSAERLAQSDPGLLRAGLAAFAGTEPTDDELADVRTWVLNRPYEGSALRTKGRVLAKDGQAGYREVPGGPFARPIRTRRWRRCWEPMSMIPGHRRQTRCSTSASHSPRPAPTGSGWRDDLAVRRCLTGSRSPSGSGTRPSCSQWSARPPATSRISSTGSWPAASISSR
jgi:anthraniloyl-CoA monooxygenase